MEEFLENNYFAIFHFVEFFAAVIGLLFYRKYKNSVVKYFIWFLVYVAIMDLIGDYPRYVKKHEFLYVIKDLLEGTKIETNKWFFTLFWSIGSALFFTFYFKKIIKSRKFIRLIQYSTWIFVLSSFVYIAFRIDAFFIQSFVFVDIFGASVILLSVVFYFIEVLQGLNVLTFHRSIHFHIGAVVFIWFLVTTPITFYDVYFSTSDMNYVRLKALMFLWCNVFMYLSFTFALLWCKPDQEVLLN